MITRILSSSSLLAGFCLVLLGQPTAAQTVTYNRDVRPILADNCFACHGPDSAARQADLRLDQRQAAIDAGAIEPGDADASALVDRIFSDDPDLIMPPPDSHKQLSAEQKQTLKKWVADGAKYEAHWSMIPPQ
ncbi:MAG: c-type cytochrome domain-containing protein, partial [Planctomycetota bacterium]